jgi:hypothetical protein
MSSLGLLLKVNQNKINNMAQYMEGFRVSTDIDNTGCESSFADDEHKEVVRVHARFFNASYKEQKDVLKLLMWWSIRYYIKILFK